jgi:AcrR family transcriptional regulator
MGHPYPYGRRDARRYGMQDRRFDKQFIRTYECGVTTKRAGRKPADDRATTERLLDTAEKLFAEHGYDGVGMRALAEEAGVNLGATTYHYGSKEKLYIEAFMRRFQPVNTARLESLRRTETAARGAPLPVETIVDCLMRPPFLTVLAHPNFPALLARNLFMPPPFMRRVLEKEMPPSLDPFVKALSKSLPDVPLELLMLRLVYSGGALLMFAGQLGGLPQRMSGNPALIEAALKELVRFVSAGLQSEPAVSAKDRPSFPMPPQPPRV